MSNSVQAVSLADCLQDRDALRAVLPANVPELTESVGVFENTWCALDLPGQPAPVAWQRNRDAHGFSVAVRYPAPFSRVKLPLGFDLEARYDAQDRSLRLTELFLTRNVHGRYHLMGRIGEVDLTTVETARESLDTMTLSSARLVITGNAGFIAKTAGGFFGVDPDEARRDAAVAADQRAAMLDKFAESMPPWLFDAGGQQELAALLRDYPHRGGTLSIELPDSPAFPFFRVYRFAVLGEIPTEAVWTKELQGLVLSLFWQPGT
ncbi:hypothetical protein [Marimonas arenosa]|uniref:Uncharacterized protein n=1 Tax=Marimonas arenosa TaxID=1795305 RepID=A0AAE3WGI6_9RHOB|nr:hypothetical protein [Marimonas arenosa]MDQ2091995.1 hypothetical protein [Marimonas arenosa]